MRIYISGPMTGRPDYEERFAEAASAIKADGHTYFNPALVARVVPDLTYEGYMAIDLEWLRFCDAICMLPGWTKSRGARLERAHAMKNGLFFYDIGTGTFSRPREAKHHGD